MTAPQPDRLARLRAARLYLIATLHWPPGPDAASDRAAEALLDRVVAAAEAGAGLVQLRLKPGPESGAGAAGPALTSARRAWLARARARLPPGTLLIVNDDLDAVLDARGASLADGVHLGRQDAAALPGGLRGARERLGPGLLLGTSTRTLEEVRAARATGADHAGFGAFAPTPTKRDTAPADPAELARTLAALPDFPVFAIGGLGPDTLDLVLAAGCRRAAVGSAILDAPDPAAAARALLARLRAPA
jgi:thiamine-phosphate pyrophosphorylase